MLFYCFSKSMRYDDNPFRVQPLVHLVEQHQGILHTRSAQARKKSFSLSPANNIP